WVLFAASFIVPVSSGAQLRAQLLKLLPLRRRQHLLQTLVGLLANLSDFRLRLFAQSFQLPARVAENLFDLRPLLIVELQAVEHLFKTFRPMFRAADSVPCAQG